MPLHDESVPLSHPAHSLTPLPSLLASFDPVHFLKRRSGGACQRPARVVAVIVMQMTLEQLYFNSLHVSFM